MKSYLGYVRVSTREQGKGVSLDEQRAAIERYAAHYNLRVSNWYEELDTAAKPGRRGFNKVLAELGRGDAAGVIIHKVDRSARDLRDWAHLGELIDNGVEVHFAHEKLDLQTRSGRLTADLLAVLAADYIRNLRDEVRKGFYGRLKQGFYPLPAPVGYVDQGGGKPKTIDPIKGPLVRHMFEQYADGRCTISTLQTEMRRMGLVSRAGRPLCRSAVSGVLHNPFYAGIIKISTTGETYLGVHDRLISKRLFDRVQLMLSGRHNQKIVKHDFLFRKRLTCVECGRSLTGERHRGTAYYRCHSRSCSRPCFREDEIEAAIKSILNLISFDEEELRDLRDLLLASETERIAQIETEKAALIQAQALCEGRLQRLTDVFLDGDIDKATMLLRKEQLLAERQELQDKLEAADEPRADEGVLQKFEIANMAQTQFDLPNSALKRQALDLVSSNIVADGKYLGIRLRKPLHEVAKSRLVLKGGPSRFTFRQGAIFCDVRNSKRELLNRRTKADLRQLVESLSIDPDISLGLHSTGFIRPEAAG